MISYARLVLLIASTRESASSTFAAESALMPKFLTILKKSFLSLYVFDLIENEFGFHVKYVTKEHLRTLSKLEIVEGHNDPNDRLIIAQATTEKIPLISSDTKFPKYRKFGLVFIFNR